MEYGADGLIKGLILLYLIIKVFFIIAQNKLINNIPVNYKSKQTNMVWLWTQLIPVWGYLAFMITLFKIEEQFQQYKIENALQENKNIINFSTTWGLVYLISLGITMFNNGLPAIFSFAIFIVPVAFIIFWLHMNKVRNSIASSKLD
jgi:hypothetical protein